MAEQKSDMEKLVADAKTMTINGVEITVEPLKNETIMEAAVQADREGADDIQFLYELVAMTLNRNEGFDVTAQEVRDSPGTILPLMNAVQEVNGLADFLEETPEEMVQSQA